MLTHRPMYMCTHTSLPPPPPPYHHHYHHHQEVSPGGSGKPLAPAHCQHPPQPSSLLSEQSVLSQPPSPLGSCHYRSRQPPSLWEPGLVITCGLLWLPGYLQHLLEAVGSSWSPWMFTSLGQEEPSVPPQTLQKGCRALRGNLALWGLSLPLPGLMPP